MPRSTRTNQDRLGSAVFLSSRETYRADRCEPLRAAVRRGEVRLRALARRGYPGRRLPARMLPEVSTVGFWDALRTPTWGLDWHRHEGLELTYLARGKTEFLLDQESFVLESGNLTITRPWQRHRVGNPRVGPSRLCWLILEVGVRRPDQAWHWPDWLILSPADLRRLTALLSHNQQPVWRANDEIGACFEKLAALVQAADPLAAQSRLQLHINELFVALLELLETRQVKRDAHFLSTRRTVERFLNALPERLEAPWTLPDLARQCGLGATAFADYCRHFTNLPPMKYLALCRIEAAKGLLRGQPALSITEVALRCGFQSSQYFATRFHQLAGRSPSAYRKQPGASP